ncbi:MAG: hypothetical protein HY741_05300 [Chloroflexi bacterium]|nr:hypothetical protein [Chloroflexota bacterium]
MPTLRIEPQLLESLTAVELGHAAQTGDRALVRDYHSFADPVYERCAPAERDKAFAQLHLVWFEQRGWRKWFGARWAEFPELAARAAGLLLLEARWKQEEGAVLGRDSTGVCLRVLPIRFANRAQFEVFVRHEFLHACDMLDPAFGYRIEHSEPCSAANASAERYRALWCAYVDARMTRRGFVSLVQPDTHRRALAHAFSALTAAQQTALFEQVWNAATLTHAELYERARRLEDKRTNAPRPGTRCPLCFFPTFDWASNIAPAVARSIRADFPTWDVSNGACARCVERYELTIHG